jgi:hypothetical protein
MYTHSCVQDVEQQAKALAERMLQEERERVSVSLASLSPALYPHQQRNHRKHHKRWFHTLQEEQATENRAKPSSLRGQLVRSQRKALVSPVIRTYASPASAPSRKSSSPASGQRQRYKASPVRRHLDLSTAHRHSSPSPSLLLRSHASSFSLKFSPYAPTYVSLSLARSPQSLSHIPEKPRSHHTPTRSSTASQHAPLEPQGPANDSATRRDDIVEKVRLLHVRSPRALCSLNQLFSCQIVFDDSDVASSSDDADTKEVALHTMMHFGSRYGH